jgi:hypothetical protein
MSDVELKQWAETWERAGRELTTLRRRELQAMTDDDVRRAVAELFSGQLPRDLPPRATSGLVEQQRLFAVLHRRT